MEPSLLIILVFILAPLIERLLKAGKQPPQGPPDQRPRMPPPQQRMPPQPTRMPPPQQRTSRAEEAPPRVVVARREDEEESAAAMLPDDLWEILTGERRPPREPEPQPELEEAFDEEEAYSLEEEHVASGRQTPVRTAEEIYTRPVPRRDVPTVVSLEPVDSDNVRRHTQFHDRLSQLSPAARVERAAPIVHHLTRAPDLRRAIIMMEVLGKPKGLEE